MVETTLFWTATSPQFGLLTGEVVCTLHRHGRGKRDAFCSVREQLQENGLSGYWTVVLSYEDARPAGRCTIKV